MITHLTHTLSPMQSVAYYCMILDRHWVVVTNSSFYLFVWIIVCVVTITEAVIIGKTTTTTKKNLKGTTAGDGASVKKKIRIR